MAMIDKICCTCKESKPIAKFSKRAANTDGYNGKCKECVKSKATLPPIDLTPLYKICFTCKVNKPIDVFGLSFYNKDGYKGNCRVCSNMSSKRFREVNKEKDLLRKKLWRGNNPEYHKNYTTQYKKDNYEKFRKSVNIRKKKRREESLHFKIQENLSNAIRSAFKRTCEGKYTKVKRTEEILGCTAAELLQHLKEQFTEGMTLENYGHCTKGNCNVWTIDHKIPVSHAKTEEDIYRLNHYTNLQPMWYDENIRKSNKLIY